MKKKESALVLLALPYATNHSEMSTEVHYVELPERRPSKRA
jgi:hypothetical protein